MNKKVLKTTSLSALAMLLGATVANAAVPVNTVIVGDKAYSIDYLMDSKNTDEISAQVAKGGNIFYKFTGESTWTNVFDSAAKVSDADLAKTLPTVTYYAATGAAGASVKVDDAQVTGFAVTAVNAANTNSTDSVSKLVEGGAQFKVVFSGAINSDDVSATNFILKSGTNNVATTRSLSADKTTVTVKPSAPLTIGAQYTLTVNAGIKQADGTASIASAVVNTFTVADNLSLVSFADQAGTEIVSGGVNDTRLDLTFNKDLDESSINTTNIKLYNTTDSKYVPVSFAALSGSGYKVIRITPNGGSYEPNKVYKLTVNGLSALDGTKLNGFSRTFGHVSSAASVSISAFTAPTNASGIYPGLATSTIRYEAASSTPATTTANGFKSSVTFDRVMDASTVNSNNIYIAKVDASGLEISNSKVDSTVSYDPNSLVATVVPKAALAEKTDYKVFVTKDVKDAYNVSVPVTSSPVFTTGDFTSPTVKSTSVDSGDAVGIRDDIVIHFSEKMDSRSFGLVATGTGEQPFTNNKSVRVIDVTTNTTIDSTTNVGLGLQTAFVDDATDPRLIITHPTAGWVAERNYRIDINGYTVGEATMSVSDKVTATKIQGNMLMGDFTKTFSSSAISAAKLLHVYAIGNAAGPNSTTANVELNKTDAVTNIQDNAAGGTNAKFKMVFDKRMALPTGSDLELWLDADDNGIYAPGEKHTILAGEFALGTTDITNDTITWTPGADVALFQAGNDEHAGQLVVKYSLTDFDGKRLGDDANSNLAYKFVLGTGPAFDNTNATPKQFATGVSTSNNLVLAFNETVDFTTVNSTNIKVTKVSDGSEMKGTWYNNTTSDVVNADAAKFDFEPTDGWSANTQYKVSVGDGILDGAGNKTVPFSYTFTTADTTTPVATVTMPSTTDGTAPIVVKFNTGMNDADGTVKDASLASGYTLNVTTSGAVTPTSVPFTVVYDDDENTATIYPDAPFAADDIVELTVNAGLIADNAKVTASQVTSSVRMASSLDYTRLNIRSAVYDASLKQLVLTLNRPVDASTVTSATSAGIVFTGSNYTANNYVGVGVSSDGLTVTYALKDDDAGSIVKPLSIVPGVSKVSLAGSITHTDSTGSVSYNPYAKSISSK